MILADEISHTVDIFNTIRRFIHVTWHPTASPLISCIGGNSNIAMLSKALRIQTGDLLFNAPFG